LTEAGDEPEEEVGGFETDVAVEATEDVAVEATEDVAVEATEETVEKP
jgi:hypothetical protein